MPFTNSPDDVGPVTEPAEQPVEVLEGTMRIHELSIETPSIVSYLQTIPAGKQTIAT